MSAEKELHVVMVEDDQELCSGWIDLFQLLGHRLQCYHRSLDALADSEAAARCDLLITDYYLPDLNGVELVKRFRSLRPELPAILLTGSKEDTVTSSARQLSLCCVLHKPVNIEELDRRIREMCRGEPAARRRPG